MATVTYLRARDASLPAGGHIPVASLTMPADPGLRIAYLMSGGLPLATRNYAPGAANGMLAGTNAPAEQGRYLRFGPRSYVDTGVPEMLGGSVLAIGRRPSGASGNPAYIGSGAGAENTAVAVLSMGPSNVVLQAGISGGRAQISVPATTSNWFLMAAIVPPSGGGYTLHNLTSGQSSTYEGSESRVNTGSETMLIGSIQNAPESWDADMLLAVQSDTVWTTEQMNAWTAWARGYAADFGVVV